MNIRTLAAAAALVLGGSFASAGVAPAPITLQDLIDAGSDGATIGDKQFYNFSYQASPLGGTHPAPTASMITVDTAPSDDIGMRFTLNLSSINGLNQDAVIRYSVHVLDSSPQNFITAVNLDFDPTVAPGALNIATVTETISKLDGTTLGQITTINMGPGAAGNNSHASFAVAPTRDLMLAKDIMVISSANGSELGAAAIGGASISTVDNTFHQASSVPLPPAAWSGLGMLGLMGAIALRHKARGLLA